MLKASDCNDLVEWLRFLPLLHNDNTLSYTLIHAGLPPQWDLEKATNCAIEVEAVLQSDDYKNFLTHMYGDLPNCWDDSLHGWDRLRFITNCFTRLRFVDQQGNLALDEKGPPGTQSENCLPWFECAHPRINSAKIIFGHWSTLGTIKSNHFFPIDSGCVWGHKLTALCINKNPSKRTGTEQDASKNITKKPDTYTEIITIDCAGACDPRDYM